MAVHASPARYIRTKQAGDQRPVQLRNSIPATTPKSPVFGKAAAQGAVDPGKVVQMWQPAWWDPGRWTRKRQNRLRTKLR